jgi:hypothetical protein
MRELHVPFGFFGKNLVYQIDFVHLATEGEKKNLKLSPIKIIVSILLLSFLQRVRAP